MDCNVLFFFWGELFALKENIGHFTPVFTCNVFDQVFVGSSLGILVVTVPGGIIHRTSTWSPVCGRSSTLSLLSLSSSFWVVKKQYRTKSSTKCERFLDLVADSCDSILAISELTLTAFDCLHEGLAFSGVASVHCVLLEMDFTVEVVPALTNCYFFICHPYAVSLYWSRILLQSKMAVSNQFI